MTKDEKSIQFYKKCIEAGYTDLTDDKQKLKAQVIASDFDLDFYNIESLFEYSQKLVAEQATEKGNKTTPSIPQDELLFSVNENILNKSFTVYSRPNGSVYTSKNNKQYESISFRIVEDYNSSFKFHEGKTVYTGASSGGVSMGGFHEIPAYMTEKSKRTGQGMLISKFGNIETVVGKIHLSTETCKKYKTHIYYKELVDSYGNILCYNSNGLSAQEQKTRYEMARNSYELIEARQQIVSSNMLSLSSLSHIKKFIEDVVYNRVPKSEEEIYQDALILSKSNKLEDVEKAIEALNSIPKYKDSSEQSKNLESLRDQLIQEKKEQLIVKKIKQKKLVNNISKILLIVLIIALVCIIIISARYQIKQTNEKSQKYDEAMSLYSNHEYALAIPIFEELSDFSNSKEMVKNSKYDEAMSLYNNHEYALAIPVFEELSDFSNSKEMVKNSKTEWLNDTILKIKNFDVEGALQDIDNMSIYPDIDTKTYDHVCDVILALENLDNQEEVPFHKIIYYIESITPYFTEKEMETKWNAVNLVNKYIDSYWISNVDELNSYCSIEIDKNGNLKTIGYAKIASSDKWVSSAPSYHNLYYSKGKVKCDLNDYYRLAFSDNCIDMVYKENNKIERFFQRQENK